MNTKNVTDSGNYVNGIYTTKNGFTGTGLGCPAGTRLYDTTKRSPFIINPPDIGATEQFTLITQDAAPDILPYYAISNYGRVMNMRSGLIMKPNYRPNGCEYYCLAAENCKYGQKKYTTHRLVMNTFCPQENSNLLQVVHLNGDMAGNYVNKTMPDGSIQSNLEWCYPDERTKYPSGNNTISMRESISKVTEYDIKNIRELYNKGYTAKQIYETMGYDYLSLSTISTICANKSFYDPNYEPRKGMPSNYNPLGVHKITDDDAKRIRALHEQGYHNKAIKRIFYPEFSESTISDIVRGLSHITN